MNPTSLAVRFIANSAVLSIFLRIVAVDGPVPGIDPQWFRKALSGAILVTATQYVADQVVAEKSFSA
jgi:hypothetical protein